MADLIGRKLDRYEIVGLLGAGGMGKVYRARDTELDRDVAIKVIPELAEEGSNRLERFNREIRTVAALAHPNIVQVHDFGSSDGVAYAVMELLSGRTLRQLLRGRPMPVDEALEIGVAIAHGLGAAHHHGVVHRDIKPENIFVTSKGEVKILDFGLARPVTPADPEVSTRSAPNQLTSPGVIVGTTGYQSPEQVRGLEVDPRSDIFSLGCVLYEMLTGRNPFLRETRVDTLSAILDYSPERLSDVLSEVSPAVDVIVDRCLKKDRESRFESARDVAFAIEALSESQSGEQPVLERRAVRQRRRLRWLGGLVAVAVLLTVGYSVLKRHEVPALPDEPHVAVARYRAVNGGDELQELADGLTAITSDSLRRVLEQTSGRAWLVPREAQSPEEIDSIDEAGRRQGANAGIVGSLEKTGSGLRLKLSLVEPGHGRVIRDEVIEDDFDNLLSFQEGPVLVSSRMLGVEPDQESLDWLESRRTNHAVAFTSYLRAQGLTLSNVDDAALDQAEPLLREAIGADPRFLAAREALASLYLARNRLSGDRQWIDRGLSTVREIKSRSPTETAFLLEARLHRAAGDHDAAVRSLAEAVRLYPSSGYAYLELGSALRSANRLDEAAEAYERAINLLPGYWRAHDKLAMLDFNRGRYDAAVNGWREVIRCAPGYDGGYTNLGMTYYMLDRPEDAKAMFERAMELTNGTDYVVLSNLGTLYFESSRFAEAADLFERALRIFDGHHTVWGNLGQTYAATRNPERAERPFRRAVELAEAELADSPDDLYLLGALASYNAMLGERTQALRYLDAAIALDPEDPTQMAVIAETYEDIDMREAALQWIGRALANGVPASRFENRPSMRGLIDDPRYQRLAAGTGVAAATDGKE